MTAVRLLLATALLLASLPAPAAAALAARVSAASSSGARAASVPALPLASLGLHRSLVAAPSLLATPSSLTSAGSPNVAAPAVAARLASALPAAAPPVAVAAAAPAPAAARARLELAGAAVAEGSPPQASDASARATADSQFSLLSGESHARRDDAVVAAADAPRSWRSLLGSPPASGPDRETARHVNRMIRGTSVMKAGTETVTLGIPLLVLDSLGGATMVAGLVVAYALARAAVGASVEGLMTRWSARRILAGAVATQAALVATVIGLGAAGLLTASTLFPLYLLIGATVGVIETSRRVIPALLLGRDDTVLAKYNARLHVFYEIAGVTGALGAGALIAFVGPLWALAVQPPAYLLAAWIFFRVRHAKPEPDPAQLRRGKLRELIGGYFRNIIDSGRLVLADARLRWVALAFVFPHIVHRVFEGLLIPVFAKRALEEPSFSAYMLTASNLGELVGALLLLKLAERFKGPSIWVKYGALGLLLAWGMVFTHSLPLLLPLIMVFSMTWASSDLTLLSTIQKTVPPKKAPGAIAFLNGAYVLGGAVASMLLGGLLDWLPMDQAFVWICAAFSVLAAAVWVAGRKLK